MNSAYGYWFTTTVELYSEAAASIIIVAERLKDRQLNVQRWPDDGGGEVLRGARGGTAVRRRTENGGRPTLRCTKTVIDKQENNQNNITRCLHDLHYIYVLMMEI